MFTRAGDAIVFEFDVLNRMIEKSPEGMPVVTFKYDLAGRITSISTPVMTGNPASGEWEYEFDTAGRLTSKEAPDGKTVSYQLDDNGNLTRLTYPDSYYVERVYDELNRLTDIKLNGSSTPAVEFDYDDLSRRTQMTFDNGVQTDYAFELNDDLASIEHAFTGSDLDFAYNFNDAHQLISQTISDSQHMWHPTGAGTAEYVSNELNQYTYASGSCGRLYKGYNANGCLIDDGVWRFSYDAENHLISAEDGTTSVDYVYDPFHRQIQKDVDGTKTRYAYSGWQRLADYDGTSDTLQKRYVFGVGLDEPLVAVSAGGALTYMHADRLGSIMALTDNTGSVTNRYAYSPWGEADSLSDTTFAFTGQRYDEETGLYYFKNRFYSPKLGRFLQPDSIGYSKDGLHLYGYAKNNPQMWTDPLGLYVQIVVSSDSNGNMTVVQFTLPIEFTGKNPISERNTYRDINDRWTGKFGRYKCVTKARKPTPEEKRKGRYNKVRVHPFYGPIPGARSETYSDQTSDWSGYAENLLDTVGGAGYHNAHEAGHLMGLNDKRGTGTCQ